MIFTFCPVFALFPLFSSKSGGEPPFATCFFILVFFFFPYFPPTNYFGLHSSMEER